MNREQTERMGTPVLFFVIDMTKGNRKRPDQDGTHRGAFEKNKRKIYATQKTCGICGKPVDFSKKYPHPLSPCIDHIIPLSKGGHPSDIENLQLAHWTCNRQKADKLAPKKEAQVQEIISNRVLPHSIEWKRYRPEKQIEKQSEKELKENASVDEEKEKKIQTQKIFF